MYASTIKSALTLLALFSGILAFPTPIPLEEHRLLEWVLPKNFTGNMNLYGAPPNNFACKSDKNPAVMLHGMTTNREVDLNMLQQHMNKLGWCTFSMTYGAYSHLPHSLLSAKDIAIFIKEINTKTGKLVDLVGNSEGAVMTIYVPMTQPGISKIVRCAVTLGPAIMCVKL